MSLARAMLIVATATAAAVIGCGESTDSPETRETAQRAQAAILAMDTAAKLDFEVDDPVSVKPPIVKPRYPESLRREQITGSVEVGFVVDTLGRVEPESIRIRASSHRYFSEAVREALVKQEWLPAVSKGRKVRQFVVQPYYFTLS